MKGLKILLVGSVLGISCSLGSFLYAQDVTGQPVTTQVVEPSNPVVQQPVVTPDVTVPQKSATELPAQTASPNPELAAPPVIGNEVTPAPIGNEAAIPPSVSQKPVAPESAAVPVASDMPLPAVSATAPDMQPTAAVPPVSNSSGNTVVANQAYTVQQLLSLGYAVEMKNFGSTAATGGNIIGKAAAWKTANGSEEFWQGVVQSDGQILIKEKMIAPKDSKLLRKDWTGGTN